LASFDVSGQWPVYFADAWPNEDYSDYEVLIHLRNGNCQEDYGKVHIFQI